MKKIVLIITCIFISTTAFAEIYYMSHKAKANPSIVITAVEVTEKNTRVYMTYYAAEHTELGLHQAGSPLAYVLVDPQTKAVYHMTGSEGIEIRPRLNRIESGKHLDFVIVFDKIQAKYFHVIEGMTKERNSNETFWDFMNVRLD